MKKVVLASIVAVFATSSVWAQTVTAPAVVKEESKDRAAGVLLKRDGTGNAATAAGSGSTAATVATGGITVGSALGAAAVTIGVAAALGGGGGGSSPAPAPTNTAN